MKALTLQQPYATLIALGAKRIETRRWHPLENPGIIAIASSKKPLTRAQEARCCQPPFVDVLGTKPGQRQPLPIGHIVALARCHRFERTEDVSAADLAREGDFGDYRTGRWAWHFDSVVALDVPVPVPESPKGKKDFRLSLWNLPDTLVQGPLAPALARIADGSA